MHSHIHYWLASIYLKGVRPRVFLKWLNKFSSIEKLFNATNDDLFRAGLTLAQIKCVKKVNWKQIDNDLNWTKESNHHLLSIADDDYPILLKEIVDPPLILFIKGNRSALSEMQIAMVGSRNATPLGLQNAEQFAFSLAKAGFAITSGLAYGIDAYSHKGALRAKGFTIAVAGTGLNHIYPEQHCSLQKRIISSDGAVVSEFPLDTPPYASNFPQRNRIISGLSMGVLVVEAALKSGSLITVRYALEHGREVFAIPGCIHYPQTRGCHHLIRQGAKLVETAADILEDLSSLQFAFPSHKQNHDLNNGTNLANNSILTGENQSLLQQIDYEITPLDVILLRSGLTMGEVSSILLTLELNGYIQSVPGGYVRTVVNEQVDNQ